MTCDWCDQEATQAGKRPSRTQGPDYLKACDKHERLIAFLGYEKADFNEAEQAERRAQIKK
jgi:hypothetical protein